MKLLLLAVIALAGIAAAQTSQKATTSTTYEKALVLEITVPAPRPAVWHAFATSDGLSTWLTPGAVVDLRSGDEWTAHYPAGNTGGGTAALLLASCLKKN
jgi:hypothetical protein